MWMVVSRQGIDSQLCSAAQAFLENDDGCMVDSVKGEVKLGQIFKWYKADFGGTDEKVACFKSMIQFEAQCSPAAFVESFSMILKLSALTLHSGAFLIQTCRCSRFISAVLPCRS